MHSAQKLCPQCWQKVQFITRPICDVFGIPHIMSGLDESEPRISLAAQLNPPKWRKARAATIYTGTAREIVHLFKYADGLHLGVLMAQAMARSGVQLLDHADVLIPIPLHWSRIFKRQYNQAHILAQHISAISGVPALPHILKRARRTPPQIGLTRAQRAKNVENAFSIPPRFANSIKGKRIVLIDDVLTTGATLNEAARLLRKAGAEHVDVLVFGVVTPNMQDEYNIH